MFLDRSINLKTFRKSKKFLSIVVKIRTRFKSCPEKMVRLHFFNRWLASGNMTYSSPDSWPSILIIAQTTFPIRGSVLLEEPVSTRPAYTLENDGSPFSFMLKSCQPYESLASKTISFELAASIVNSFVALL
jgi:hypothetical protein